MRGLIIVVLWTTSVYAAPPAPPELLAAYDADPKAKAIARALYDDYGDVATVGQREQMDGGYRGKIQLVPELPTHAYRKQLEYVAAAMADIDRFFAGLSTPPSYRWRNLTFRFVRSLHKRTPSAYATGWSITHNVVGSLLTTAAGVRDTYVHELFHLNDFDHDDWSAKALAKDYTAIVKRCRIAVRCLAPYAPGSTKVRASGTYYAFQPNNGDGVHEYAAELALRYFREQTEMRANGRLSGPAFKCGPPENARAWRALVDEFFAGNDLVPAC